MPSAASASSIAYATDALSLVDVDLLFVPWFEGDAAGAVPTLDAATAGEIDRALASKEFQAKPYEIFLTAVGGTGWRPGVSRSSAPAAKANGAARSRDGSRRRLLPRRHGSAVWLASDLFCAAVSWRSRRRSRKD